MYFSQKMGSSVQNWAILAGSYIRAQSTIG